MEQTTEQSARDDPRAWNDNRASNTAAPVKARVAVKEPGFRQKYNERQLSKKAVLGMMAVAAILTMIVGFKWGGWVTGGAVQKQVSSGAQSAITLRLAPICVAQFNLDAEKTSKLTELKAITSSYERVNYVKAQGWATMPGEKSPDNNVANACTQLLTES